ncbi:MAG TPA: signal peptidase I [Acidimicrobiales bacterium]|nr:signal peptidase I [Acidimicrobiales bacterium]
MAKTRRILGWTAWLAVMGAIAALVVPNFLGYDRYVIVSGSMTGTFNQGSVIFDKPKPTAELKVGDIITYTPPAPTGVNHLVSHRIQSIKLADDGVTRVYRTKGDANPGADPWTFALNAPTQNVEHFSVPYVGYALMALSNPHIRMALIGLPAAVIALMALMDVFDIAVPSLRRRVRTA